MQEVVLNNERKCETCESEKFKRKIIDDECAESTLSKKHKENETTTDCINDEDFNLFEYIDGDDFSIEDFNKYFDIEWDSCGCCKIVDKANQY